MIKFTFFDAPSSRNFCNDGLARLDCDNSNFFIAYPGPFEGGFIQVPFAPACQGGLESAVFEEENKTQLNLVF